MGTKNNPGKFDCYTNAHPDEPMFILLGRDRHAPFLVWLWAVMRWFRGEAHAKVAEAFDCSRQMREWRRNPKPPLPREERERPPRRQEEAVLADPGPPGANGLDADCRRAGRGVVYRRHSRRQDASEAAAVSARTDLAIVGAYLALQRVCICGHDHQKHAIAATATEPDFCYACAAEDDGRGRDQPCSKFASATAIVDVVPRELTGDLAAEQVQRVERLLAIKPLVAALSLESSVVYGAIGHIAERHCGDIAAALGSTGDWVHPLESLFLGWVLGNGVVAQDANARRARINELLAIVAHAAEKSAALSAQLELRGLH